MSETVLIVDDEADVLDLLRYNLQKAGLQVITAGNGKDGLQIARANRPDVLVLDLMMPGMNGLEVCREIRGRRDTIDLPVLMLTAKGTPQDRIHGLETGADDYLTKPFSPKELVLRVQGLLRRSANKNGSAKTQIGEFIVDKNNFEILVSGKRLDLTTTEFKLLCLLIERRGRTQSRETLLYDVWGYENSIDTRTVDTHVRRLREKLGDLAPRIETVRGSGYRFMVPDHVLENSGEVD